MASFLREEFEPDPALDRKSTRLNSSHSSISYAVFCLKKKKKKPKQNNNKHITNYTQINYKTLVISHHTTLFHLLVLHFLCDISLFFFFFFFFNDTATTEIYTLSLHDALPISGCLTQLA